VCAALQGTKLPFDILQDRAVFYTDDMLGTHTLQTDLGKAIAKALAGDARADNPVTRAARDNRVLKLADELPTSDGQGVILKHILEQLERLGQQRAPQLGQSGLRGPLRFVFSIRGIDATETQALIREVGELPWVDGVDVQQLETRKAAFRIRSKVDASSIDVSELEALISSNGASVERPGIRIVVLDSAKV
jgi:hypothetical protein